MSNELIDILDRAVASVVQEFHKDASVVVQFAASDWNAIKEALAKLKGDAPAPLAGSEEPQGEGSSPAVVTPPESEPASSPEPEPAPFEPASPAPESFLPPGI